MSKREWTAKSRGNKLGYRIFEFFLKHFGVRFAYANLLYVAPYFIPFAPKSTKAIWYYYRQVFGYGILKSAWSLYLHYFRFGQCIVDQMAVRCGLQDKFKYEFENYQELLNLLDSNKGAVLIGAHVGDWQMGGSFFGDYGKKLNIVMVDAEYEHVKKYVEGENKNFNVIPINKMDSLDTILTIKRALNAGEFVCMQGDRYVNEERTLTTQFLGKTAEFPEGPYLLASKLRLPVVFFYSIRHKMGYHFQFTIIDPQTDNGKMTKEELLQRYIEVLERVVRENPQQWFNFYQFWKQ